MKGQRRRSRQSVVECCGERGRREDEEESTGRLGVDGMRTRSGSREACAGVGFGRGRGRRMAVRVPDGVWVVCVGVFDQCPVLSRVSTCTILLFHLVMPCHATSTVQPFPCRCHFIMQGRGTKQSRIMLCGIMTRRLIASLVAHLFLFRLSSFELNASLVESRCILS